MKHDRALFLTGLIFLAIAAILLIGSKFQIRVTYLQLQGKPAQRFVNVGWPGNLAGHSLSGEGARLEDIYEWYGLKHVCFCGASSRTTIKQKLLPNTKPPPNLTTAHRNQLSVGQREQVKNALASLKTNIPQQYVMDTLAKTPWTNLECIVQAGGSPAYCWQLYSTEKAANLLLVFDGTVNPPRFLEYALCGDGWNKND